MPTDPSDSSRRLTVGDRAGGGRRAELVGATGTIAEAELDADGAVTLLRVLPVAAPKAPPLWFAELRESAAAPPAVNLIAFTGAGQRPDSVVSGADVSNLAVASSDQLGAVRWYPATGEVDQIYVSPGWRRRSIATALVTTAGMLSVVRDWPRLWGDGQRTELGEAWRNASPWRDRAAELTHVAAPMTPGS